jgi:ribosomal protein S18 acetylase RimI-like enzyme
MTKSKPPERKLPGARLRQAESGDIDSMVALLDQLFSIEKDFAVDPAKQRRGLAELMARDDACVLVCEHDGEIIGMCTVQVLISTAEGGKAGLLEDMVVAESWRGHGIGCALLAGAEAWSANHGLTRLQLLADATNGPALGFYRRQNWAGTRLIALRKLL